MTWRSALPILALGLVACGRTSRDPRPQSAGGETGRGGEAGAAGEPSVPRAPSPNQPFAFGVAMPADREEPSPAFACTAEGAFEVGMSRFSTGRLSPDGLHWAVARPDDSVEVVEAPSLTTRRLAGAGVDLATLRWSDDGQRLGYFARGWPMLANGDGSEGKALDFTLPDPDDEVDLPQVEWSRDGQRVGFLTRGVAMVAQADGSVPRALTRDAARVTIPWGLAFSHDANWAAVVQQSSRLLAVVDTTSLQVDRTDLGQTATVQGWSIGDQWLLASSPDSTATLLTSTDNRFTTWSGVEPLALGGHAAPSPTADEIAISRRGVVLLSPTTMSERRLSMSLLETGPIFYRADGRALQYLDVSTVRVSSTDGSLLAENPSWGLFGPGEWFAAPQPGRLVILRLDAPGQGIVVDSSLPTKLLEGGGAWLEGGRFALADEQGVHLIDLDGTTRVVCPGVTRVDAPQARRTNAY